MVSTDYADERPTGATASAAATVANLGPGYDVLGLCLAEPRDVVRAERTASGDVVLVEVRGDGGALSRVAAENCAGVAAAAVLARLGRPGDGVRLWLDKRLPLGSGMGSSAASAVAAALATAAVVAPGAPREELLDACREGERLATGVPHPDNVAPSLLGGIVACVPRPGDAVEVVPLPVPDGLWVACVKPDVTVRTADARAVLPAMVPLADAAHQLAVIAAFVAALGRGDLALLGRCLEDRLVTPHRRRFIPGFDAVCAAATGAGALGAGISGSGPTVFALADGRGAAEAAAVAMVAAFWAEGRRAVHTVSPVDRGGARLEPAHP
jgi:homoserine kinase